MKSSKKRLIGLAALALGGTALANPAMDPSHMQSEDLRISQAVQARLIEDAKVIPTMPLHVSTYQGRVAISGEVESVPMIYRTVELARAIPGVQTVNVDDLDVN